MAQEARGTSSTNFLFLLRTSWARSFHDVFFVEVAGPYLCLTIWIMKRKRQSSSSPMKNNRTVNFSSSNTHTLHYEDKIARKSLIWYNSADLARFREDRKVDATRIKNRENSENETCFWGLERTLVPNIRRKTILSRRAVRKAVLTTQQDGACVETIRSSSIAHSEYSLKMAQSKGRYYSNHLWSVKLV